MSKKTFTQEEINILLQNPYTFRVKNNTISFTLELKKIFMEKYRQGMMPRQILLEHGYDPEILGDCRIWGIAQRIKNEYFESDGCFSKERVQHRKPKEPTGQLSEKEEIKQLRQEVDYLKQEIEFLKKISSVRITRK